MADKGELKLIPCGPMVEGEQQKCKTGICCKNPNNPIDLAFCVPECSGENSQEMKGYSADPPYLVYGLVAAGALIGIVALASVMK